MHEISLAVVRTDNLKHDRILLQVIRHFFFLNTKGKGIDTQEHNIELNIDIYM